MKAFLASAGIFFSLFFAGDSLMCEQCVNLNGNSCSGTLATCDVNTTSCENGIIEVTYGGNTIFTALKTCARFPQCHTYFFSETIGDVQFRMQKYCCSTDNCNADPSVLPQRNSTPNGVECPLCNAENTNTSCEATETMQCTGLETKCQNFVGTVLQNEKVVTIAMRNCISKEPCDTDWLSWQDGPFFEALHFSCDTDDNDDGDDH